jgi:hypothetical protein
MQARHAWQKIPCGGGELRFEPKSKTSNPPLERRRNGMKLICYAVDPDYSVDIRPASHDRDWIDQTREQNAKRCLPLSAANSHG